MFISTLRTHNLETHGVKKLHLAQRASPGHLNPGSTNEYERRDPDSHGYLWRFNNYWRIEEKDGGVYVQNESVTLSRTFPEVLAWLINPLIKNIPRNILLNLLTDTRENPVANSR